MGDYTSARKFYYRLCSPVYHTLIITSDILVFHECTNGPFERSETVYAPWSPKENEYESVKNFMNKLANSI